jgi:hypothetical protein
MKTWATRKNKSQYYRNNTPASSSDGMDPIGVALTLSRRMLSILKEKRIINIQAHLEMIALGITMCSEVRFISHVFNHMISLPH